MMDLLDKQYLKTPFYGSRRMKVSLEREGYIVIRKRVVSLMKRMGISVIYPKPKLSKGRLDHKIYPYLLNNVKVDRANFVWSTDITYIRIGKGRALDNIFIERLWRSVKYEKVYLKDYQEVEETKESINQYFDFYNNERPHQSLNYQTSSSIDFE